MDTPVDNRRHADMTRIVVAEDGDEYVLGRPDRRIFVAVPRPGAVFVRAVHDGASVAEATALASEAAGAPVDGEGFIAGLAAAGLLDQSGPETGSQGERASAADPPDGRRVREVRWIEGVKPATARRLFGPVAWCVYGSAAALAVTLLALEPGLRPSYEQVFFLSDPVLSLLLLVPAALLQAAAHEAGHWLAGRAIGVPATFRVSYRGVFLVFETDLSQLVTVPRRRRYGPFLAGMAVDATVLGTVLGLRLAHQNGLLVLPAVLDRFLAGFAYCVVFALAWQVAAVFLRNDCYAVLANALRCNNLYRATWLTSKRLLWRLSEPESPELEMIRPHDRSVARWFAVLYLAGLAAMAWVAAAYTIPTAVSLVVWVVQHLLTLAPDQLAFWEAVAVLVITVGQWGAPPLLAIRERRLRRSGRLQ